ncbi:MAG: class II D-tagatose-bisphosphate aldolase, non-catalytic subunit [Oscillospiraceae bacterium]|nr:class II D-tagatose-bisphosphate aldolase, non-catalytic subunit [Oscillospiraceae bacterium]
MDVKTYFEALVQSHRSDTPWGIHSVCCTHPYVLQAAMEEAALQGAPVLIESTANQVNQDGGYTGMTPEDFRNFVYAIADKCAFDRERILLGGDHLGPHPWRKLPAETAMEKAAEMVACYVQAGFTKIHLDTSMHLGDDDHTVPLPDQVIAERSAMICRVAEDVSQGKTPLIYVVGSEVPPPGGPESAEDEIHPTSRQAFLSAYQAYQQVFTQAGLENVLSRVVAFVVQPGVEFGGDHVFDYNSEHAQDLCAALRETGRPMVFEGHSTDYQTPDALAQLIRDGVGILKVGPGLTFALREGLYALEAMEKELVQDGQKSDFATVLDQEMLDNDQYWRPFYRGDDHSLYLQRRYSYYDRTRYYLGQPKVAAAMELLLQNLAKTGIPEEMLSQYLPLVYYKVRAGELDKTPEAILKGHVRYVLAAYQAAAKPGSFQG